MKQDNGNHTATPGPWIWERVNAEQSLTEHTLKGPDVLCRFWYDKPPSPDAWLIAAAPELLEALDMLLNETVTVLTKHFAQPRHDMIEDVPSIAKARTVLAKAKGD